MSGFETWGDATVTEGDQQQSNLDPPNQDGDYIALLVKATALTSKKEDDYVVLEWRELQSGWEWTVLLGFKSQAQANLTKTACSKLGLNVDEIVSLAQLADELSVLAGGYYDVHVKTNGEYRNTYVNGPSIEERTDVPVPLVQVPAVAADDDEIPF